MSAKNPLRKLVNFANKMPDWLGPRIITFAFNSQVKLAGTASLKILHTDGQSVTFFQQNKKKVQNHIGGVHAAAMALLAESATGFIVGINLPGDKLPLIKSMKLNYVKRATGDLKAVASLTEEQIALMTSTEKGEVLVKVAVSDEKMIEPVTAEMLWAWVPKKR
jgi:acyl-coenzyme A thioesterase PaaI-like protein